MRSSSQSGVRQYVDIRNDKARGIQSNQWIFKGYYSQGYHDLFGVRE